MATRATVASPRSATRCSFCGKADKDVRKLIAGPGVYICDECVGVCREILAANPGPRTAKMRWEDTLDDEELLHHLGRVAGASTQIDESLQIWVGTLRQRGVTWARIGEALGITRQSAWERFSGEE